MGVSAAWTLLRGLAAAGVQLRISADRDTAGRGFLTEMLALRVATDRFLVGMAIGGLAFGMYMAVDLALVADVLPDKASATKDLGVFDIAGALPFSIAPAIAPAVLRSAAGATACCTRSPAAVPSPEPLPSCP